MEGLSDPLAGTLYGGTKMRSAPVPNLVGSDLRHGGLYRGHRLLPEASLDMPLPPAPTPPTTGRNYLPTFVGAGNGDRTLSPRTGPTLRKRGGQWAVPASLTGDRLLFRNALSMFVVCALKRHVESSGANPDRRCSSQPEALGAVQEVTNGLKHSKKRLRRESAGRAGCNAQ